MCDGASSQLAAIPPSKLGDPLGPRGQLTSLEALSMWDDVLMRSSKGADSKMHGPARLTLAASFLFGQLGTHFLKSSALPCTTACAMVVPHHAT